MTTAQAQKVCNFPWLIGSWASLTMVAFSPQLLLTTKFLIGSLATYLIYKSFGRHLIVRRDRRPRPYILAFGDSLTQGGFDIQQQGWVSQIAHVYTRRMDVVNRGFSGYNSRWLLRMLPELFPYYLYRSHPPSLITCLVGSNDSTLPVSRQHVPLEEFKENIRKIVAYFKGMGGRRNNIPVILLTPPPLDERGWADYCGQTGKDMDRTFELTRLYSRAAKTVGEELSLPVIDLHEILKGEEGPEVFKVFFYDGLHFSGKGNTVVAEQILHTINENFPHLEMEKVPMEGPSWADIQPNQAHIPRYSTEI